MTEYRQNFTEFAQIPRREFRNFFIRKYARLLKAAFDKNEKRPDYKDLEVIGNIIQSFEAWREPRPAPADDKLPRKIFMLWQQGWDSAPPLVRACADSWAHHNPDWEIFLLDNNSLREHAPDYAPELAPKAGRPAQANLARLSLLKNHGGVWADATLFCSRPLDDWLPAAAASGLFMFAEPRPYRYSDIWFMAASKNAYTIRAWQNLARQYWGHFSRPHHYYWMEYLFEMLCAEDAKVADLWASVPKISALGPLTVGGNPFDTNAPQSVFDLIAEGVIPAHKLSHKWRFNGSLAGTPVGTLTGLEKL